MFVRAHSRWRFVPDSASSTVDLFWDSVLLYHQNIKQLNSYALKFFRFRWLKIAIRVLEGIHFINNISKNCTRSLKSELWSGSVINMQWSRHRWAVVMVQWWCRKDTISTTHFKITYYFLRFCVTPILNTYYGLWQEMWTFFGSHATVML